MAKGNLETYILEKYKGKEVNANAVFRDFYGLDDIAEIKDLENKKEELKKERAKLKRKEWKPFTILIVKHWEEIKKIKARIKRRHARIKRRHERVDLAFNQLFLRGLVQGCFDRDSWLSFEELKKKYINKTKERIKSFEKIVKKGNAGIFEKCWLSNLYDYLEKAQRGEIIRTKDWNKLTQRNAKGKLVYVGSELCYYVFPETIRVPKVDNNFQKTK